MRTLESLLARHPLAKKPYNAIRFVRFDGNGMPLYTVGKDKKALGAANALKAAFEQWGGHCFHCKEWMRPQPLSQNCTRDHLRPRSDGGQSYLHNLVLACGRCNRDKGGNDLISFRLEAGVEYMKALDAHLARCIATMAKTSR